ncbi:MAG TPA: DJ-1/PfpI family protein [Hyphomicrobiales bacterium]|nr:DJ-1/PfpI family protein [Hyphomicrobiales bacterium]
MRDAFRIGFPVFPDLTPLDFAGPWEVLTRLPGSACMIVAHDRAPVRAANGMTIMPTTTLSDCPPLDMVCVPGGPGHLAMMENEPLLAFLRAQAPGCRYVTAVCTGTLVLAAAGLLGGVKATTHWMSFERLAAFGAIPTKGRVVRDGRFITGGGVTAGIDFALEVATIIAGAELAKAIQLQIEYAPEPPYPGSPDRADPAVVAAQRERMAAYRGRMAEVDARVAERLAESADGRQAHAGAA